MSDQPQPPHVRSRHLLLLIDGTWVSASQLRPGEQQSNIYWLNLFVEPESEAGETQLAFYIAGIGSATRGQKWGGGVFAYRLDRFVEEAYINIVSNFHPTDKIYIFGFSRGAVIARLVAYLISKFGVLEPRKVEFFSYMWEHVKGSSRVTEAEIKGYCYQDVHVEFLGLFDTVGGPMMKDQADIVTKIFRDRTLPRMVKTAVHILAMHESRSEFRPVLFKAVEDTGQHLEQIWMPGVHSDVGGGYTQDFLGNISLITMLDRLKQKTALKFDEDRLSTLHTSIRVDFDHEKAAVNNELGKWWEWPFSRIRGKFGWKQRKPSEDDKCQFYHPVCNPPWLEGRFVRMKSALQKEVFRMEEFTGKKGWPILDPTRVPPLEP